MGLLLMLALAGACGPREAGIAGPGALPEHAPNPVVEALRLRPPVGLRPDGDGVLFRLSVRGGGNDVMLSLEEDGRVVRVDDTSVFSSTADYTTWRLSPAGVARMVEAVENSGVLAVRPNRDSGDVEPETGRTVSLFAGPSTATPDDQLTDVLLDHSRLAAEIVEPPHPFVPDTMTVLAGRPSPRSGLRPDAPFNPWPYDRPVEAMARGTQVDPYGEEEVVVCLSGAEVFPLFSLMTGVNHAYLRVDDGRRWEVNVQPRTPGYRLYGDPCGPPPARSALTRAEEAAMVPLLVELMEDLESVGFEHPEVFDTDVRERMADALVRGFVDREPGFELPADFGMFSAAGDQLVRQALQEFLGPALRAAEGMHQRRTRLRALWNPYAVSITGSTIDDFLEAS